VVVRLEWSIENDPFLTGFKVFSSKLLSVFSFDFVTFITRFVLDDSCNGVFIFSFAKKTSIKEIDLSNIPCLRASNLSWTLGFTVFITDNDVAKNHVCFLIKICLSLVADLEVNLSLIFVINLNLFSIKVLHCFHCALDLVAFTLAIETLDRRVTRDKLSKEAEVRCQKIIGFTK